jgi:hypothetical protein
VTGSRIAARVQTTVKQSSALANEDAARTYECYAYKLRGYTATLLASPVGSASRCSPAPATPR